MNSDRLIRSWLLAAAMLWSLAVLPRLAAESGAAGAASSLRTGTDDLAGFGTFLDQHPEIEARLRESPAILHSPAFQRNHPVITQFLAHHPGIRAELGARPRWFLYRELQRRTGAPVTRAQVAEFDRLLDQHPALEKTLVEHPRLLAQADFLSNQADLRDFLKRHPAAEREVKPERRPKADRKN